MNKKLDRTCTTWLGSSCSDGIDAAAQPPRSKEQDMNFHKIPTLLAASSLLLTSACATTGMVDSGTPSDVDQDELLDIVGTADAAGSFTTLMAALEAAGLVDTLRGEGPFTVFAPTDAAFAALPEGTVEALLEDIPALTDILLYHVVPGAVPAADVATQSLVGTAQGSDFKVTIDGDVFINGAKVVTPDIVASNGVIHVIDQVLLPPASIAEIAAGSDDFTTLVAALGAADLVETLSGEGPFTVFAPTDAAFAALPEGTVEALLNDIPALTQILLFHVAGEKLPASDVVLRTAIETLEGSSAEVVVDADGVQIAGARVSMTDIPASNGVIHVLDAVMLP
jgi:transforming growth factor-beta-induced protein